MGHGIGENRRTRHGRVAEEGQFWWLSRWAGSEP